MCPPLPPLRVVTLLSLWLAGHGSADSRTPAPGWHEVRPGPWGQIEFREVILEPPASSWMQLILEERDCWRFPGLTREEVVQGLRRIGIDERWHGAIADDRYWQVDDWGCRYFPPLEMFLDLAEAHQEAVYLWQLDLEPREFFRYSITLEKDYQSYLEDLPGEWVRLIDRAGYRMGDSFCVSGISYLEKALGGNREDTMELFQAMARTRSLMPRLRIEPGTDLEALVAYWSAGGRNPVGESILRSIGNPVEPVAMDLVHLLPQVPRRYLNTFLVEHDIWLDTAPDCFWSTVNFFEIRPSARALDPLSFAHYVVDDLELVDEPEGTDRPPSGFGDVVVLSRADSDEFLHSYIHVAGEIVFTKNGKSPLAPWVLMREDDMLSRYGHVPAKKLVFRRIPR